jgi:hypothetical protein
MQQNTAAVPASVCVRSHMQQKYTNRKVAGTSYFMFCMDKFLVLHLFHGTALAKTSLF